MSNNKVIEEEIKERGREEAEKRRESAVHSTSETMTKKRESDGW